MGVPGLKLACHIYSRPYVRAADTEHDRIVTFTLINRTDMSGLTPKDSECLFQCGFSVEGADGTVCFLEHPERENPKTSAGGGDEAVKREEEEEESLRLLYRHRKTFAVGHGCAAQWQDTEASVIAAIRTETLSAFEIKPILPREIPGLELSMLRLSDRDDVSNTQTCARLAGEYRNWIEIQAGVVNGDDFSEEYRPTARRHLELCRACHKRIVDGIQLLQADADTRQAFAWMNEAMLQQQLHYDLAVNHRRTWVGKGAALTLEKPNQSPDASNPAKGKGLWRPFQLAFILMNLRAIARRDDPGRDLVDPIWFPTGGGKTEAYLGLTAFTIFRRRLLDPRDSGTTVLMRYTLRLLTTQQFQRAASLICACEMIRRRHESRLGDVRISVGLWVGQSVTPNKNRDAIEALDGLRRNGKPNPFVVLGAWATWTRP